MNQSQISNYTNPNPIYNCPHFAAWALAKRCERWGIHNLRNGYKPPHLESVILRPARLGSEVREPFTSDMFSETGFLHEVPMNFYLSLRPSGSSDTFSLNAGYLMYHFILSEKLGYAELGRLLKYAPTIPSDIPEPDTQLQAAGAEPEGGTTSDTGGESD